MYIDRCDTMPSHQNRFVDIKDQIARNKGMFRKKIRCDL
jgi:hypothetical protein